MPMKYWFWLGICAVCGFGQEAAPLDAIIAALRPFQSARAYRGAFIQNYWFERSGDSLELRRKIRFANARQFQIEQTAPFPQVSYVSDGVRWVYAPDLLQYTKAPFQPSIDPVESTSLSRLAGMVVRNAGFLPDADLKIEGARYRCKVVYGEFRPRTGSVWAKVTLYVDARGSLRRAVTSGSGQTVTTTILSLELDPAFVIGDFHFVPPPQAVAVERIIRFSNSAPHRAPISHP